MVGFLARELELLFAGFANKISLNVVQVLFHFCKMFVNLFDIFGCFKNFESEFVCCVAFVVFVIVVIVVIFLILDLLLI